MKLSKRQSEVIDLMKDGWSLEYRKYAKYYLLIRGHGVVSVNMNTHNSLEAQGIIELEFGGRDSNYYKLTDKAKEL